MQSSGRFGMLPSEKRRRAKLVCKKLHEVGKVLVKSDFPFTLNDRYLAHQDKMFATWQVRIRHAISTLGEMNELSSSQAFEYRQLIEYVCKLFARHRQNCSDMRQLFV